MSWHIVAVIELCCEVRVTGVRLPLHWIEGVVFSCN